jgi:TM2 domain-containing membrane protein YozV
MSDTPPQIPASSAQSAPSSKDLMRFENEKKSAGVALFLCWVFGAFGAHRFYMGRPNAVIMLITTLVSIPLCFVIIGFFGLLAVWIWVIVDLFSVSRWAREYNTALLSKIQSGQG